MKKNWFRKLRERQEKKAIEKARRDAADASRKHVEVINRANLATATFLRFERICTPPDMLQGLAAEAAQALTEMHAMHQAEIADIATALDLVQNTSEGK